MVPVPLYTSELAPAHLRGLYVGFAGIWAAFGFALSTYMGIAFFDADGSVEWRMPLGIGAILCVIMVLGIYFIPESPRSLLLHDKAEAALVVEISQHTVKGTDEDFARAEFVQMQKQTDLERKLDASWLSFLRKPLYRRRLIIVIITIITTQSSGNLVINAYVLPPCSRNWNIRLTLIGRHSLWLLRLSAVSAACVSVRLHHLSTWLQRYRRPYSR